MAITSRAATCSWRSSRANRPGPLSRCTTTRQRPNARRFFCGPGARLSNADPHTFLSRQYGKDSTDRLFGLCAKGSKAGSNELPDRLCTELANEHRLTTAQITSRPTVHGGKRSTVASRTCYISPATFDPCEELEGKRCIARLLIQPAAFCSPPLGSKTHSGDEKLAQTQIQSCS